MTEARSSKRVTLAAAIIAGAVTVSSAVATLVFAVQTHSATLTLNKGQEEIHVLVNRRLSEALAKIARLELRLATAANDPKGIAEAERSILEAEEQIKLGDKLKESK